MLQEQRQTGHLRHVKNGTEDSRGDLTSSSSRTRRVRLTLMSPGVAGWSCQTVKTRARHQKSGCTFSPGTVKSAILPDMPCANTARLRNAKVFALSEGALAMSLRKRARAKRKPAPPSWLNLGVHGLYRDVRKLIYKKLDAFDRALVEQAHIINREVKLNTVFAAECVFRGHLGLLQWAREKGCPWDVYVPLRSLRRASGSAAVAA